MVRIIPFKEKASSSFCDLLHAPLMVFDPPVAVELLFRVLLEEENEPIESIHYFQTVQALNTAHWWLFQVEEALSEVDFQLKLDLHFTESEQQ